MFSPLQFHVTQGSNENVINISRALLSESLEMSEGLRQIGIGIGSIMLLIVVIYYVITMMDGGKFQMKMLVPVLMYFLVCHFTWVARPVLSFTTTITESVTSALASKKDSLLNPDGKTKSATPFDDFIRKKADKFIDSGTNEPVQGEEEEILDNAALKDMNFKQVATKFGDFIWRSSIAGSLIRSFSTSGEPMSEKINDITTLPGLLCQLMSWLSLAFSFCLRLFGIMMTAIVVAFGPITFAFAIFPGKGSNVVSWFIRICQFALFAPLCAFIDTFTVSSYLLLETVASNAVGYMMIFAITLANIIGLISVPTIASMIIEGASGAVMLSQGIQSMAAATTMAGGGILAATAGMDNGFTNFMAGMKHKGLVGFGREVRDNGFGGAVKNISEYGRGALYGWNIQNGNNPEGTSSSGDPEGTASA